LGLVGLLSLAACGPPPPQDPFNLAEAKDSLNKGYHWYQRGCHREAARFFVEGEAYARLADAAPLIVMAKNSLGAAYLAQGRLNEAASSLAEALDLTLTLPGHPELDSVLGNLGSLAYKAKRDKDAVDFWTRALESAPAGRQAIYLANLARLNQARGQEAEFAAQVEMALAAAENSQTPDFARADALSLGAALALSRGEADLAERRLTEALALDRHAENASGLAQSLELAGKALLAKGQFPEAAQSLDRSFHLFAAIKDKEGTNRLYALLRQTHEKGYPKSLAVYQEILKNPQAFNPLEGLCP
jgi:tetratricopeptide (TPR) repeat protein